ncbi:hypothetical protein TCAL_05575 [Tigriopus californicus]|uniref:Calcium uniporter protein n=1 Tax=Tigriopus californicus TaxID=6832 RepID=A0A553NEZ2_TIGCA|nr:calcium uniporter protein, mitochondrial-like [Tigriopus californicus]TRY64014.1 hypothetical protein TCAL_05575 [Tigriopus californicus]|eukprot:TCALIF_05575-PA protein Name:"Similar to mcu Calcium uniporter protein, mitochondrial (Danio rerio)" AED:0.02 eAED:0.02 QI:1285/1/1/1/1/1/2/845/418
MLTNKLLRQLLNTQVNTYVPIWSCRVRDNLIPLRVGRCASRWLNAQGSVPPYSCSVAKLSTNSDDDHGASPTSSPNFPTKATVSVEMKYGLPQITVPLPSRNEPCVFTLKPITHTVGDFLEMLQKEDAGIDRAVIRNIDGIRIASTTSIQNLMQSGEFDLMINDVPYRIRPPFKEHFDDLVVVEKDLENVGNIRSLVGELYEALHVEEHQAAQEQRMIQEIESLKQELGPLERQRQLLADYAQRRTKHLTWLGLGLMSVQFGVLARLTWWEYSWDIMEPVTYFVTYGTAIACYAYFTLTNQDYILPDVRDRQYLFSFYKKARREDWNVQRYNHLQEDMQRIEQDLQRLRDPISLKLPASLTAKHAGLGKRDGSPGGILGAQINIGNIKNMIKDKFKSGAGGVNSSEGNTGGTGPSSSN